MTMVLRLDMHIPVLHVDKPEIEMVQNRPSNSTCESL